MRTKVNDFDRIRSRRLPSPGWLGLLESCVSCWLDDAIYGGKTTRQIALADFEAAAECPEEVPLLEMLSLGTGIEPTELLCLLRKICEKKRHELEAAKSDPRTRSRINSKRSQPVREGTLRWWRQCAGLSQARLAQLSGVAEEEIRNIEVGETRPKPGTAKQLCVALNLNPGDVKEFAALQIDLTNHKAA